MLRSSSQSWSVNMLQAQIQTVDMLGRLLGTPCPGRSIPGMDAAGVDRRCLLLSLPSNTSGVSDPVGQERQPTLQPFLPTTKAIKSNSSSPI